MTSSYTTNKSLEKPGNGDYVDTWNVPVNGDMDIIDQAFGGVTSLNATSGSATLTSSQYRSAMISVSGAMSADVTYTIPSGVGGFWIIRNTTTDSSGGPWTVTVASGGGGTSTLIERNINTIIFSDGTNIRATTSPIPGSTTQVIFNSSGTLAGSAGMTWNGTTLTATNLAGGNGTFSGNVTVTGTFGVTAAATFTSTVTASTVSDSIGNVRNLPFNTQTTAYTLIASDSGKVIYTSGNNVIVPPSVFSQGQTITIFNNSGSATMTVSQGSGVTIVKAGTTSTGTRTLDTYALVTLVCVDPTTFVIAGAGLN